MIERILDASTSHVLPRDIDLAIKHLTSYPYDCGVFVYIPYSDEGTFNDFVEKASGKGCSDAFINLVRKAKGCECWLLRLDADGDIMMGMSTFDEEWKRAKSEGPFSVDMDSEDYGSDTFDYESAGEAIAALWRLMASSRLGGDSIERTYTLRPKEGYADKH